MLNSADRLNRSWLPIHLRVHLPQITIFISHEQIPSDHVAQLVSRTKVIGYGGREFEFHRCHIFFLFLGVGLFQL